MFNMFSKFSKINKYKILGIQKVKQIDFQLVELIKGQITLLKLTAKKWKNSYKVGLQFTINVKTNGTQFKPQK